MTPVLLALLLQGPPPVGFYYEQLTTTSTEGQPAGPGVRSRVYCAGRRLRLESLDVSGPAFVLRLDRNEAFRIDPEARTATALDVRRLRARSQMDLSMAGDLMGGSEEGAARVVPLKAPRTLAGFACRGYRLIGPAVTMELYVTTALPVGIESFAEFLEWSGAVQSLPGILPALRGIPGFPLETRARTSVLGEVHETVATITKIQMGQQPASLFEVPAGYRVIQEQAPPEEE